MNTRKIRTALMIGLLLLTSFFSNVVFAEIIVIINSNNPTESISKVKLSQIFLGKVDSITNSNKMTPVNQNGSSDLRKIFDKQMLKRTTKQVKAYWIKQLFSGNGSPPKELGSDSDVINYIVGDETAISYIDSSALNSSVKVLRIM